MGGKEGRNQDVSGINTIGRLQKMMSWNLQINISPLCLLGRTVDAVSTKYSFHLKGDKRQFILKLNMYHMAQKHRFELLPTPCSTVTSFMIFYNNKTKSYTIRFSNSLVETSGSQIPPGTGNFCYTLQMLSDDFLSLLAGGLFVHPKEFT